MAILKQKSRMLDFFFEIFAKCYTMHSFLSQNKYFYNIAEANRLFLKQSEFPSAFFSLRSFCYARGLCLRYLSPLIIPD